jgi:hypothetical protein
LENIDEVDNLTDDEYIKGGSKREAKNKLEKDASKKNLQRKKRKKSI